MLVEILPRGIGGGEPLVLEATLVIVRWPDGTPMCVAGAYGPDGVVRASHCKDKDFNETLRKLGIDRTVICDELVLPPPPTGARLIRGPERNL